MSYHLTAHRSLVAEQQLRLIREGGPGWHPYVLDQAERDVKEDPVVHGGLVAAVEAEIGPKGVKVARDALKQFNSKGAR